MQPSDENTAESAAPEAPVLDASMTEDPTTQNEPSPQEPSSQEPSSQESGPPKALASKPSSPPPPLFPRKANKKPRRSHEPEGYQDFVRLPAVTDDNLRSDLVDFGYPPEKVTSLANQQQPIWDKWRNPDCVEGKMQAERERKEKGEADRKRRRLMDKYEPLFLEKWSKWALFDSLVHKFPAIRDGVPEGVGVPAAFTKFERFQPGNTRIVEINLTKKSVRLRSTPSVLQGKRISYEQTGPKIISDEVEEDDAAPAGPVTAATKPKAKKGRPGRPRKTAPPVFSSPTTSPAKKVDPPSTKKVDQPATKNVEAPKPAVKPKPVQRPKIRKPVVSQELVEDSDSELSSLEEE